MAKKYRFRKVYFVCKDKEVLPANVRTETVFKWPNDAKAAQESIALDIKSYKLNSPSWKEPRFTVEGFYLVHESLYDEVIEQFQKDNLRVLK